MKPRTITVAAMLVVAALFAALNWSAFTTPTRLSLLFDRFEAPLGLIMLCFVGLLSVVYLALLARIETSAMLERHRQTRELDRLRKLVEEDEESRLRRLENYLAQEFGALHDRMSELSNDRAASKAARAERGETRPDQPAATPT